MTESKETYLIDLDGTQEKFPFFKPDLRANLFTLEKAGRVFAVGIPKL